MQQTGENETRQMEEAAQKLASAFDQPIDAAVETTEQPFLTSIFETWIWNDESVSALRLTVLLIVGGFVALYIRFLYRRFSASASDTDSITRVFPLLLMVTTSVIAVVQSSLALSLGLVGALSIVRFRAAIKDPEELVYLFLCIALGLALGAEKVYLALGLVSVATLFVIGMHRMGKSARNQKLLLTIRGSADRFHDGADGVAAVLGNSVSNWLLHRMDIENGHGQLRVSLEKMSSHETTTLISALREKLPDCEFSYVNMNSAV